MGSNTEKQEKIYTEIGLSIAVAPTANPIFSASVSFSSLTQIENQENVNLPNSCCGFTTSYSQFLDLFPPNLKPEHIKSFKRSKGIRNLHLTRETTWCASQRNWIPWRVTSDSVISNFSEKRHIDDAEGSKENDVHDTFEQLDTNFGYKIVYWWNYNSWLNIWRLLVQHQYLFPYRPTKREWAELRAAIKTGIAMTGVAALGEVGTVCKTSQHWEKWQILHISGSSSRGKERW